MSTLRETLDNAFKVIDRKITAKAVDRLKERSEDLELSIKNEYTNFFYYMDRAIRVRANWVSGDTGGLPGSLVAPGSAPYTWRPLSDSWNEKKGKFSRGANPDASILNIYHGLTEILASGRLRTTRGRRKRTYKKPRIKESFGTFISNLDDQADLQQIERLFGPLKTKYELIRPDGGRTEIKLSNAGIDQIIQYLPRKPRQKAVVTTSLPGTRLQFTVQAFTAIRPQTSEIAIVDRVSKQIQSPQWVKIVNSHRKIRPLFGPLINWYLRKHFASVAKRLYENDSK